MTRNDVTNWIIVNYTATSLYSVIADGNYSETNAGRAEWMSLINGAKLQSNCNKESFNVQCSCLWRGYTGRKSRIGIAGNDQHDCDTCDSVIGFGIKIASDQFNWIWSSGNLQKNPEKQTLKTFGYIFVQWLTLQSEWLIRQLLMKDFKTYLHNKTTYTCNALKESFKTYIYIELYKYILKLLSCTLLKKELNFIILILGQTDQRVILRSLKNWYPRWIVLSDLRITAPWRNAQHIF